MRRATPGNDDYDCLALRYPNAEAFDSLASSESKRLASVARLMVEYVVGYMAVSDANETASIMLA